MKKLRRYIENTLWCATSVLVHTIALFFLWSTDF